MLRSIWAFCVALMAAAAFVAVPAAAEPQYSRAPDVIPIDHDDNNSRVCCKRGSHDWWSTERECRRAGGQQTYNRECRRDESWNDQDYGNGRWNERTCCRRDERQGYRILWSTKGECRRFGGQEATNKTCRKYGGFHPYDREYDGNYGWQDGNQNERVCCARSGQVWWSTRGECRRASGYQTTNKTCRRN